MDPERVPILMGWEDLAEREERAGFHVGDPILLSPDCRIDVVLSLYLCRSSFARLAAETKRNCKDDYCVFFEFLWGRGKAWSEATRDELWDFAACRVSGVMAASAHWPGGCHSIIRIVASSLSSLCR
ncbi:hypothetical protein ACFW1M_43615 [Streptomyces inhibens]|uniref:hypothetical protein n=1 Tax=Streptomyces inhibens TaxID=2293571 RepID=UPI0036D13CFA